MEIKNLFGYEINDKGVILGLKGTPIKKNNMIMDVSSLIMFTKTTKATAYCKPFFINEGNKIINVNSLIKSSVMFDSTCGIIFSFPKKYPLSILDILINGNTKPILINA